jgi:hypothetical protein
MLQTKFNAPQSWAGEELNAQLLSFVQKITENELAEFREGLTSFENQADEMLVEFADAVATVKPLSLLQFEPDWRRKLLRVAQELFTLPRWILGDEFPEEYKGLREDYVSFVIESDGMGEDVLEFMISWERRDLEDVRDLFDDLAEGVAKLETMLTARWRKIAMLKRQEHAARRPPPDHQ